MFTSCFCIGTSSLIIMRYLKTHCQCYSAWDSYLLVLTETPGRSPCCCVCFRSTGWKFIWVIWPPSAAVETCLLSLIERTTPLHPHSQAEAVAGKSAECWKVWKKFNTSPLFLLVFNTIDVVSSQNVLLYIWPRDRRQHAPCDEWFFPLPYLLQCWQDVVCMCEGRGQPEWGSSLTTFAVMLPSPDVFFCPPANQRRQNLTWPLTGWWECAVL